MSAFNQSVNPSNPSQAIVELDSRTNFLREVLDKISAGKSLIRLNVPISVDVQIGHSVYWNQAAARYDRAMGILTVDPVSGNLVSTNQAQCVGICTAKDSATVGSIGLSGYVTASSAFLLNMTGSATPVPGTYYLSNDTPGRCVRARPGVPIHVAYIQSPSAICGIEYEVLIIPGVEDLVSDHIHLQFEMFAQPAGTHIPPAIGGTHTISPATPLTPGWLPAGHAIFNGRAPVGAKFGYNLSQHLSLNRHWPPVPAEALALEFTDYETLSNRVGGLRRVDPSFYQVNDYGLWWMSDCYGQIPWDRTINTTVAPAPPAAGCLSANVARMFASFGKTTFTTKDNAVLRITGDTAGIIRYVDPDGAPAATGYLTTVFSPNSAISNTTALGSSVLKTITPNSLSFTAGRMTEGLLSTSSEISLSGTHSRLLNPLLPAGAGNPLVHQGVITLAFSNTGAVIDLPASLVWLGDTLQREFGQIRYIGFPPGRVSKLTVRFDIPYETALLEFTLQVKIALIIGRLAGPVPAMTAQYFILRRPSTALPQTITAFDTQISVTFDATTPTTGRPANVVVAVNTAPIAVFAGDSVLVTFTRNVDAYNTDIGFARVSGLLVKAPNWTSFPN